MPISIFQNQGLNPQMIAQIKGINICLTDD